MTSTVRTPIRLARSSPNDLTLLFQALIKDPTDHNIRHALADEIQATNPTLSANTSPWNPIHADNMVRWLRDPNQEIHVAPHHPQNYTGYPTKGSTYRVEPIQTGWHDVVFMQGEDYEEPARILDQEGPEAAADYLSQWHNHGEHQVFNQGDASHPIEVPGPHGGTYEIRHNPRMGHIGMQWRSPNAGKTPRMNSWTGRPNEEEPTQMSRIRYAQERQRNTPEQDEALFLDAIAKDPENMVLHHAYADHLADQGRHGEAHFVRTPGLNSHPNGSSGDFDSYDWNNRFNGTGPHEGVPGKSRYLVYGFHPYHPDRTTQVSITRVLPDSSKKVRISKWFNASDAVDLIRKLEEHGVTRASSGQTPNAGSYEDIYQQLQRWIGHQSQYPDSTPQTVSEQDHYPIRNSAYRAPKGGAVVRGTYYQGGKLIPDLEGDFANPPVPEQPVVQYPQPKRSLRDRLKAKFKRSDPLVVSYARSIKYASNLKHSHPYGDEFNNWFAGSKVTDEAGSPKTVYHGSMRGDRIGNRLLKGRSTSGPMPYFTDDPDIAASYSTGKQDTSLTYSGPDDYAQQFTIKVGRNQVPIDRAWWHLNPSERQTISQMAPRVKGDDEGQNLIEVGGPEHRTGTGGYDHHIREAKGNHLKALVEEWLNSGNLFNSEHEFLDVLKHAGLDREVKYNDPHAVRSATLPTHLSIKNPLVTTDIHPDTVRELERAAFRQRKKTQTYGADQWDKNTRDPRDWIAQLKQDVAEGRNSFVWTSIPDWVTKTLQRLGYDGVHDTGGKMGGTGHNVYVPFHPDQVRVAMGKPSAAN